MDNNRGTEKQAELDEGLYKRIISFTKKQSKFDEMKVDVLGRCNGADGCPEFSCAGLRKVVQDDVAAVLSGRLDLGKNDRPQLLRRLVLERDGAKRAELWRAVAARYRPMTSQDEGAAKEKLSKFIMGDAALKEAIVRTTAAAIDDYARALFGGFERRMADFEKSEREYREKERLLRLQEEERQRKEHEERERELARKRELEERRLAELKEEQERKAREEREKDERERERLKRREEEKEERRRKEKEKKEKATENEKGKEKGKESWKERSVKKEEIASDSDEESEESGSERDHESDRKERKRKRKEGEKERKKRQKRERKEKTEAKRREGGSPASKEQGQTTPDAELVATPKLSPDEGCKPAPRTKTPRTPKQKRKYCIVIFSYFLLILFFSFFLFPLSSFFSFFFFLFLLFSLSSFFFFFFSIPFLSFFFLSSK